MSLHPLDNFQQRRGIVDLIPLNNQINDFFAVKMGEKKISEFQFRMKGSPIGSEETSFFKRDGSIHTVYDWSLEIKPGLKLDFTAQGIGGHWQNFMNLWCRKFEIFLHLDIDHKSDVLLGYVCFQKFAWRKDQQGVYCRREYFIEIQQNPANVTTDQLGATIDPSSCYKYWHIFWGIRVGGFTDRQHSRRFWQNYYSAATESQRKAYCFLVVRSVKMNARTG